MSKKKILIVEDEALIAMTIEEALTHMGYEACGPVSNGNRLGIAIEECNPDLILMDVMLPGNQDGIDLANVLKDLYKIPVVFLTASSNKSVFERAKHADSYGYLIKPFNNRDLKNTIEIALFKFESQLKIAKSEEKYKSLFEYSTEEVYLVDPISLKIIDANSKALENIQYSSEELQNLKLTDITPKGPGSVKDKFSVILKLLTGKETHFKVVHRRKDGSFYPIEIKAKVISIDGKKVIQAYGTDITERIKAEQIKDIIFNVSRKGNEIIEFKEYFDSIKLEISKIFTFDKFYVAIKKEHSLEFVYYNGEDKVALKKLKRDFGSGFSEHVITSGLQLIVNDDNREKIIKKNGLKIYGKKSATWVGFPIRNVHGVAFGNLAFLNYSTSSSFSKKDGELLKYLSEQIGLFVQKKMAEKILLISEERNKAILEAIPDMMFRTNLEGFYLDYHVNNKKGELLPTNKVSNLKMQDVLPKEIWEPELRLSKKVVENGVQEIFEYKYDEKYFECRIVKSGKNEVLKIIRDITENRKLQGEIEESEKRYRTIYEKSPVGILSVSSIGQIISVNEYLLKMIGYKKNELIGEKLGILIPSKISEAKHDMWMKAFYRNPEIRGMVNDEREVSIVHREGYEIPVEINLSYVEDELGVMGLALIHNIADKKVAEKTQKSLVEKELQLKEIHHRVKNNMQVISSLLSLQSMAIDDKVVKEKFIESQNRISTMSLIHEKLYQTNNFNEIDFGDYLKDLVPYIVNGYPLSTFLNVKYDLKKLELPLEQAIPCGLIINELISNSVKYAFINQNKGVITVKCHQENGNAYLFVSDNGIGIADEKIMSKNSKSLGLKLITSLTKQLNGMVELGRTDRGTKCEINFPITHE